MPFDLLDPRPDAICDVVDGIKVYTGEVKCDANRSKRAEEMGVESQLFSRLTPSVLTAQGHFSHVKFNEEELGGTLTLNGGNILFIGCNFMELENPNPSVPRKVPTAKNSKRGRKKKVKKTSRKVQGSGRYFNSQITSEIYNPANHNIYKIKLFRTGKLQVPGVRCEKMSDLTPPLLDLTKYLRKEFADDRIHVVGLSAVMRNYTCHLVNLDHKIFLNTLHRVLISAKKGRIWDDSMWTIMSVIPDHREVMKYTSGLDWLSEVKDVLHPVFHGSENLLDEYLDGHNPIGMAEILCNCERYPGLLVKFNRPVPWDPNKKTTIRVRRSGRINFDGCNSRRDAIELYHWLHNVFKNNPSVIYDPGDPEPSSSSSSGESMYDDMLDSSDEDLSSDDESGGSSD